MNVVITGASKGIGRAIAKRFAAEGATLVICARNALHLSDFQKSLQKEFSSVQVHIMAVDLAQKEQVEAFAEFVLQHIEKIDVLINNVGAFAPGNVHDAEAGVLEHLMDINVFSAFYLTRALMPSFLQQGNGHIFNMCSIASLAPRANSGLYVVSKFALLGFSKSLRFELKEKGIKVTAVLPGPTWSSAWEGSGFSKAQMIDAKEVAEAIWCAFRMGPSAVVEELVIQPPLGDI